MFAFKTQPFILKTLPLCTWKLFIFLSHIAEFLCEFIFEKGYNIYLFMYLVKRIKDYLKLSFKRQPQNLDVRFHSFYSFAPDSSELLDSHSSRLYATGMTIWISLGEWP